MIHAENVPLSDDVDIGEIADSTDGYVGADLEAVCREAVMAAMREDFDTDKVRMKHFNAALKKVRPALNEDIREYYKRMEEQFKGKTKTEQKSYIGYR